MKNKTVLTKLMVENSVDGLSVVSYITQELAEKQLLNLLNGDDKIESLHTYFSVVDKYIKDFLDGYSLANNLLTEDLQVIRREIVCKFIKLVASKSLEISLLETILNGMSNYCVMSFSEDYGARKVCALIRDIWSEVVSEEVHFTFIHRLLNPSEKSIDNSPWVVGIIKTDAFKKLQAASLPLNDNMPNAVFSFDDKIGIAYSVRSDELVRILENALYEDIYTNVHKYFSEEVLGQSSIRINMDKDGVWFSEKQPSSGVELIGVKMELATIKSKITSVLI